MKIDDEPPEKHPIAAQDTRPNFFLFVPYELGMIFCIAFFAIDTGTHTLKNGFIVAPFWILAALLVRRDVNGVRAFFVRVYLWSLLFDQHRWGGLSTSPWPVKSKVQRDAV